MSEVLLETMSLGPQLKLPILFISTEATTVTCLIEKNAHPIYNGEWLVFINVRTGIQ